MKNKNLSTDKSIVSNVYDDDDTPPIDIQNLIPGEQELDDRPRQDGPGGN